MRLQDQIAIVTGAASGFGADGLRCTDTERSNWVAVTRLDANRNKSIDVVPIEPVCIPKTSSCDDFVIVKLQVLHELWGQYSWPVSAGLTGVRCPKMK